MLAPELGCGICGDLSSLAFSAAGRPHDRFRSIHVADERSRLCVPEIRFCKIRDEDRQGSALRSAPTIVRFLRFSSRAGRF
jgi:hypothetical protein